jgi:nitroimidazol reductase NimA-like FMN-containing flavoprotein (pyridoxamine 5'-phosphate oxidase superfamily)
MRRKEKEAGIDVVEEIIRKADVCRIAFSDSGTPYIVTLNFGYSGAPEQRLFFHCAPKGRKLEMMEKNNYVCFEMDTSHNLYTGNEPCDWGMKYESVVGYGRLKVVEGREERQEGMNCIMEHYGYSGKAIFRESTFEKTIILMLEISEMTGKKS